MSKTIPMARVLTGIQSTGVPHLGNILGAILPAIEMANDSKNESYLFIANMHTLTQIKNAEELLKDWNIDELGLHAMFNRDGETLRLLDDANRLVEMI